MDAFVVTPPAVPPAASPVTAPLVDLTHPRTSMGALFADVVVAALRAWLASGATGPALATASPGSGLSTLIRLLVRETALEGVWVTSGTPRLKAFLEQVASSPVSVTMRRKVLVIDEFDAMSGDSVAASEVLSFVRSKPPLPVLIAAHSTRSQKSQEFAKGWPRFAFRRLTDKAVEGYLAKVATRHGVPVGGPELADLAASVRGDLRAALMALDLRRRGSGGGSGSGPEATTVDVKDEVSDGLDLVESVLRGQRGGTVAECLRLFGMESAVLPMGIYENYLAGLGKDDLDAAAAAADAFAQADCVDRYMYSRQAWDVHDVYGVYGVAAPSLAFRCLRRSKPSASFGVTKFGSVWSKVYNMCAKTKHLKTIATRYAEAGVRPLSSCDLAYVRRAVREVLDRGSGGDDDAELRRLCWPLTAADVLCLARMDPGGSGWYKQACHARIKKLLAPPPAAG